jgi:hypothetical protein
VNQQANVGVPIPLLIECGGEFSATRSLFR